MSFKNIFDNGGDQAGSADQSAQKLGRDTPGAGSVSEEVRRLESERDPWLVRQTAHGAFDVMGFLGPLFQSTQGVAAAQREVTENPGSATAMASSASKAFGPPKVSIRDEDMPKLEELSKLIANKRSYSLIATGLGTSEGVAVDPSGSPVYVADRGGQRLIAVKPDTGAQRVVASGLGDLGDVALDTAAGKAYTTDWSGGRLLVVDLAGGTSAKVADVPGAYGVALDTAARKAYVANWTDGQLIEVALPGGQKTTLLSGLGQGIGGVALSGDGKAYIGQKDNGGKLFEVDLAKRTYRVLTALTGATTIRVALDGSGRAYTIDHAGGRLYEITLADGAQRVVASGLETCEGLTLDTVNGWIYVTNREGRLWQIDRSAVQALGGVGKVVP
ncbi:SMP-30/gluconolaconase/LRE-like protein [Streptomyces sp. 3211.6]|uniref:SMP-30/gluconolactonase/LRE family protein n=1 Tax=unclassified Streptomyces TaxID=2593676 RepID=UPI000EB0E07B|nr:MULTISPECIES: SMP-30/gluconolactonase/LRE family protein [unclassified Streptomyces]RKT05630.1 SMP-30/gluconolaconase/LRE-like protein [Streptomyces sp. 3211.6]RPF41566.1 SMP-30/gluconolaconase/LRE-like protein [Streptomyces sp. Ag109_G2-6]